ncbi:MAG TPA: uroporphyrinogen-III synthase [Ktedonobacterales bacterium]|nr:uroporphyrinogen-III synthase [Ktedonobacterales bacterium]
MTTNTPRAASDERPADDALPLAGRRIAITRPREQADALARQLEALGARVTLLAAIRIAPIEDSAPLDAAIAQLGSYDWLVFTSVNGVAAFTERLAATDHTWDERGLAQVAAIGPATAAALERAGVPVALMPDEYVAEGILDGLGMVAGQRLLLARADIARRTLAEGLRLRGAEVDEVAAYRTIPQPVAPELIERILGDERGERVDAITFTSSSTALGLLQGLAATGREPVEALRGVALAAIGPITAATLREHGLEPAVVAREYTIPGLTTALVAYFSGQSAPDDAASQGAL